MKKRIIAVVLSLFMLVTAIPVGMIAYAEPIIALVVGSTKLTVADLSEDYVGNGWAWSFSKRSLILNGYKGSGNPGVEYPGYIYCNTNLKIQLYGSNSLNVAGATFGYSAIRADGDITIVGKKLNETDATASLTITNSVSTASSMIDVNFCGISAAGDIDISGCRLSSSATGSSKGYNYGIFADGSISIYDNAVVSASARTNGEAARGIYAAGTGITISDTSSLSASGSCTKVGCGIATPGTLTINTSASVTGDGSTQGVFVKGFDLGTSGIAEPAGGLFKSAGGGYYSVYDGSDVAEHVVFRSDVTSSYGVIVPLPEGANYYVSSPARPDSVFTGSDGVEYASYNITGNELPLTVKTDAGYVFSSFNVYSAENLFTILDSGRKLDTRVTSCINKQACDLQYPTGKAYYLQITTKYDGQKDYGALVKIDNGSHYSVKQPVNADETYSYVGGTGYCYYFSSSKTFSFEAEKDYIISSVDLYTATNMSSLRTSGGKLYHIYDNPAKDSEMSVQIPSGAAFQAIVRTVYVGQEFYGVCIPVSADKHYSITSPKRADNTIQLANGTRQFDVYYLNGGESQTFTISADTGFTFDSVRIYTASSISAFLSSDGVLLEDVAGAVGQSSVNYLFEQGKAYRIEAVTRANNVATPVISPASGTTFEESLKVYITCSTPGALVCYTTDGSTPTIVSREYTGAIEINQSTVIKAVAFYGEYSSAVASSEFVLYADTPVKDSVNVVRISGNDRYMTALDICDEGWSAADAVILASGKNYPDALCGVPLSGALDAPILLTNGVGELEASVAEKISNLGAKTVYILGGTSAVSAAAETYLKGKVKVKRLWGATRYETSVAVAQELLSIKGVPSTIFFASAESFADALSVSTIAALNGCPILYASKSSASLNNAVTNYIKASSCKSAVILGGTGAISSGAENAVKAAGLTSVKRIAGLDRYDTANKVFAAYKNIFSKGDVAIATGKDYPDALAGSALAVRRSIPLMIVDGFKPSSVTKAAIKALDIDKLYVFGGTQAISPATASWLAE